MVTASPAVSPSVVARILMTQKPSVIAGTLASASSRICRSFIGDRFSECAAVGLARERVADRQAAVDDHGMAVDVARLVGRQEQSGVGDFDWLAAAPQRVQLADHLVLTGGLSHVVNALGHAGLDEAGADGVDADIAVA